MTLIYNFDFFICMFVGRLMNVGYNVSTPLMLGKAYAAIQVVRSYIICMTAVFDRGMDYADL